jgi:DAK2 domain fusion protein YloV
MAGAHSLTEKYPLDTPLPALDSMDLRALIAAAYRWLSAHAEEVNRLNVYPVRDGDTGTNMVLTLKSAWHEVVARGGDTIGEVIHAAAAGALHGSRGNSGVILSQILRGMSQSLSGELFLTRQNLTPALQRACETAYQGVPSPVEGTILTVARAVSLAAMALPPQVTCLRTLFTHLVAAAGQAVQQTPELLPILKQAGVVDAGGRGLMLCLEGMQRALMGEMALPGELVAPAASPALPKGRRPLPPVRWGFDVQCLIEQPSQPVAVIRQAIAQMGEHALVEGDEHLVKIHLHTLDPGAPLSYAAQVGFVTDVVVDNLDEQTAQVEAGMAGQSSPVRLAGDDTTASQPQRTSDIGLVAVTPGQGFATIFRDLGVGAIVNGGQTMNPSTEELMAAIASLPNQRILILPNHSNVILAAQQAAELAAQATPPREVLVIPTKTAPQGIAALLGCNPAAEDLSRVAGQMQENIVQVDTGEVTEAIRNAEFDGLTVEVGDFVGLHDGRLVTRGQTSEEVVFALLEQMAADESELIIIYYGETIAAEAAQNLIERVRAHYPDQEVELAYGGQAHYHYILSTE